MENIGSENVWSSGNVFADLNVEGAEVELLRARLGAIIRDIIKKRELSQRSAAKLIGLTQPELSKIIGGKLTGFTIDRLLRVSIRLNQVVDIHLAPTRTDVRMADFQPTDSRLLATT